ncbi:MAG: hypothetical protein ACI915_000503 [Gammaproteobacteria bacterium]|jgi:hypothetical protein
MLSNEVGRSIKSAFLTIGYIGDFNDLAKCTGNVLAVATDIKIRLHCSGRRQNPIAHTCIVTAPDGFDEGAFGLTKRESRWHSD